MDENVHIYIRYKNECIVRPMQQIRYRTATLIAEQHNILIDDPDQQIIELLILAVSSPPSLNDIC